MLCGFVVLLSFMILNRKNSSTDSLYMNEDSFDLRNQTTSRPNDLSTVCRFKALFLFCYPFCSLSWQMLKTIFHLSRGHGIDFIETLNL